MFTTAFWVAAFERAVKTFAQAAVALLTADATGLLGVDWGQTASVAGLAALVSVLTSIASSGAGNTGPSLASETVARTPHFEER